MQIKKPLVSVIVPVYNRENSIASCLEMVLNQSYTRLEVIVVDDGSSDSSLDIVKKYPVTLIEHEINKGPSAARNTGMDCANGDYIHFLDDDDKINSTFYENLLSAAEEFQADIACCSMINEKIMNKSQIMTCKRVYTSLKAKYESTYVAKNGFVWRYLFRMDFLNNNKLRFEEGRFIEDLPFSFAAVFFANKIVTVPNAKYIYSFTPNSILNTQSEEKRAKIEVDLKHAKDYIFNFAKEHGDFKIPGLNTGIPRYFFKKLSLNIRLTIKYRDVKYMKF